MVEWFGLYIIEYKATKITDRFSRIASFFNKEYHPTKKGCPGFPKQPSVW